MEEGVVDGRGGGCSIPQLNTLRVTQYKYSEGHLV